MTRTLAVRLSRGLVACYPRRWRQRCLTAIVDTIPSGPQSGTAADETISRWSLTAEGTVIHTTTISHYTASAGGPLALDAAGRTLARGAPPQGGDIVYLWMLP
jgi:hypothetical protein